MAPEHELVFAYSEWLDGQGLVVSDEGPEADKRSHDELVRQFLAMREPHPLARRAHPPFRP